MPLSEDERLGPYEILSMLGKGGMGEVYRARDTRLGREVAIKVSAQQFSERFEREARAVAALNHPNICTLYDVGPNYLVMELVEGQNLSELIRAGAIPLEESLKFAQQICDALEAAHEKGIVHRDLKPANIRIKADGTVKVLDFGLAKISPESTDFSESADTLTIGATVAGTILGTAGYMPPEQARGKSVDKRADIWAFGVVLYEMVTGEYLHKSETVSDTLASVLKEEPRWEKVPPAIERVLRRCLEKDPRNRLRDIGDAMPLIEDSPMAVKPVRSSRLPWTAAALVAIAALVLAVLYVRQKPPTPPEVMRFQIRLPDKVAFTNAGTFTLSPDGRHLAFSAMDADGHAKVWIQDLDAIEARPLTNTSTGNSPPPVFWSPDSRFVAYSENSSKLKKVDVQTGLTQDICDKPGPPVGGSWNSDGTIIFGSNISGLWRVPAAGGTAVPLTKLDPARHERAHELPSFLPDGKHFIYLRFSASAEEDGIFVGSLDDPPERQSKKPLLATSFGAYYVSQAAAKPASITSPITSPIASSIASPRGWLLFVREGTLMAQSFDPQKLELQGDPAPVAERLGSAYETPHFSASSSAVVYRTASAGRAYQLTWFDSEGKPGNTVGEPGSIVNTRLSPDGTRLAYRKDAPNLVDQDIWMLDLVRGTNTRFTFGPGVAQYPVWSPDGSELVFSSNREGVFNLYRKSANGANDEELLLQSKEHKGGFSWSRDGKFLLYGTSQEANFIKQDLWVLPMQGDRTPIAFLSTRFNDAFGSFSPDGRWVAYGSDESGRGEMYVRPFMPSAGSAEGSGKWIISKDGGQGMPRWRDDGRELLYADLKGMLVAVRVDVGTPVEALSPRPLFQVPAGASAWVATGDLKRFLIAVPVEQKVPQTFSVMLNWTSVLKTR